MQTPFCQCGPGRLILMCLLFLASLVAVPAGQGTLQEFRFRDYLGHDWLNELVTVDLNPDLVPKLTKRDRGMVRLVGPDQRVVPHQLVENSDGLQVAFLVDLPAMGEVTYRLVTSADQVTKSSLRVAVVDGCVRLENALFGIDIRQALVGIEGPIAGIRMVSGGWGGDSSLHAERKLVSYEANVTASGPVYGEVSIKATFEGDTTWTMRVRVIEGEPVAVVDEDFMLADGSYWALNVSTGLDLNQGIFRTGWYRPKEWPGHALFSRPLFGGKRDPFMLLPWINWSNGHQVSCVSLYREDEGARFVHDAGTRGILRQLGASGAAHVAPDNRDVLFLAAGRGDIWARADQDWGPDTAVPLKAADGKTALRFQLAGPARHWMLGTTTFDKTLVLDKDLMAAEPYAIKHCGTTLQEVREMTLVWGGPEAMASYPRVGFGGKTTAAASATVLRKQATDAVASIQPARQSCRMSTRGMARTGTTSAATTTGCGPIRVAEVALSQSLTKPWATGPSPPRNSSSFEPAWLFGPTRLPAPISIRTSVAGVPIRI